jgi:hypothetical protein
MLQLLTDEQISPVVAEQTCRKFAGISVVAIHDWRGGGFMGSEDANVLREAARDGLTLLSYDQRTIPPLLKTLAVQGVVHMGVVFVDMKTIPSHDIGGLVRAIGQLWVNERHLDWRNRVTFLRPAR